MPRPKLKKMGNPNNQTVDAVRGVSAEALRAKRLAEKTPSGQQDENRLVSYDPAHVRAAIEAQMCPFCGAGPFGVLAGHTVRAHGIDRTQLRSLGGYTAKESICSPDAHARFGAHTQRLQGGGKLWRGNSLHGGHQLTEEGKRRQAEKNRKRGARIREMYEADPDICVSCGAAISYDKHRVANGPLLTCSDECNRARAAKKTLEQWASDRAAIARAKCPTPPERVIRFCAACGKQLGLHAARRAKTCGKECADVLRRKPDGACAVCGGPVKRVLSRMPAKTCSRDCLMKLFAERDAKRRHARGECMVCGGRIPDSAAPTAKTCSDQCLRRGRSEWASRARAAKPSGRAHTSPTATPELKP